MGVIKKFFKRGEKIIDEGKVLDDLKKSIVSIKSDLFLKTTPNLNVYEIKSIDGFINKDTVQVSIRDGSKEKYTQLSIKVHEISEFIEILKNDSNNFKKLKSNLINLNYKLTLKYD